MPGRRAGGPAATKASSSKSGSSGSRAMWAISGGSSAPPGETESPPNIRWSTNRSSDRRPPSDRRRARTGPAGAARRGRRRGCTSSWPLIPRWAEHRVAAVERQPEVLARAGAAPSTTVRPVSRAAKSSAPARWRRTGRGCSTSTASSGAADDVAPRGRAGRPRPRAARAPASVLAQLPSGTVAVLGGDGAVGGLGGLLLGLLLRPAGAVAVEAARRPAPAAVKVFSWSGPSSSMTYSGTPRECAGGQLLQAGLPVQAGAEAGRRSPSAGRTAGARPRRRPRSRR